MSRPRPNLIGTRFGRLVVIADAPDNTVGLRRVLCRCSCGAEALACVDYLRAGSTRSCGCLNAELTAARNRARAAAQRARRAA